MTREAFDQLVSFLEARYQGRHPALARRAMMFALVGYIGLAVFLLAGIALVLAMVAMILLKPGFVTIKIGLVVGIPAALLTWAVLKGLWVRLHPPEGLILGKEDAPELFRIIEETSAQAGGVNFDTVLLTDELNASVVQIPRLGVFGWYRTYLMLGLPLMDALSPDEFQAVLAHEFAHLSHQHGRLGTWLYRLRASWCRVIDSLSESGAPRPVRAFVEWFWPRFNASAFVLSRSQEYQADAFGASVTSPEISGRALQRLVVESNRLDESFWGELTKETITEPKAPADVFHRMQRFFDTATEHPKVNRWLANAMAMQTGTSDTHPGLKDRLAALGVVAVANGALPPVSVRASSQWLPAELSTKSRERFSQEWHRNAAGKWEEIHREKQQLREQLAAKKEPTTPTEEWELLCARSVLEGSEKVQEALLEFLTRNPDHLEANFRRGEYLADQDDLAAIPFFEKVARNPEASLAAIGAMADLYDRLGMGEEVFKLKRRADQHDSRVEGAIKESSGLSKYDIYRSADLDETERSSLLAGLEKQKFVRNAWIVRKELPSMPELRNFVLVVEIKYPMFHFAGEGADVKILNEILDDFKTESQVRAFSKNSHIKAGMKKIAKVEGSLIKSKS